MHISQNGPGILLTIIILIMINCIVAGARATSLPLGGPDWQLPVARDDPNELRWDLAPGFAFAWDAAELSIKVLNPGESASPDSTPSSCALTISGRVDILDARGLVTIDVSSPGVCEVIDSDGNVVECLPDDHGVARCYEQRGWFWLDSGTFMPKQWFPFKAVARFPSGPEQKLPSRIARLTGYIRVVYAYEVLLVDVPFDAGSAWSAVKGYEDLLYRVEPSTPPPPGPRKGGTPIAIYRWATRIKSKTGGPMMGLCDPAWRGIESLPLGDYAIVRTGLSDSTGKPDVAVWDQGVDSDPWGERGAGCGGSMEQNNNSYDRIRHVIAVRPVEVRIPFVLTNIPVPNVASTGK